MNEWCSQGLLANVKEFLDHAAEDKSPGGIVGLANVWLAAELFSLHEQARVEQLQDTATVSDESEQV